MNPSYSQQEPLYCFCQSKGDDERFMIQYFNVSFECLIHRCSYCAEWFHLDCVDSTLSESEAMNLLEFFCPIVRSILMRMNSC